MFLRPFKLKTLTVKSIFLEKTKRHSKLLTVVENHNDNPQTPAQEVSSVTTPKNLNYSGLD